MSVNIKRIYEPPTSGDGYRILVDRLWPRGIKKSDAQIEEWTKALAPSTDLRKWFAHQADRWKPFHARYLRELKSAEAQDKLRELAHRSRETTVTLLYAARDEEHNHAVILKTIIENLAKKSKSARR